MATIAFTDEDLKKPFFVEMQERPNGLRVFGGFFTEEMVLRARTTRQSWSMVQSWYRRMGKEIPMSQRLYFVAQLFAEIEAQDEPPRENPCAEVPMRGFMDRTNIDFDDHGNPRSWDTERYRKTDIKRHETPNLRAQTINSDFEDTTCPATGLPCTKGCFSRVESSCRIDREQYDNSAA